MYNDTLLDMNMCNDGNASMPGYIESECVNTIGSHVCECPMPGYMLDMETYLCKGVYPESVTNKLYVQLRDFISEG